MDEWRHGEPIKVGGLFQAGEIDAIAHVENKYPTDRLNALIANNGWEEQ